MKKLILKLGIIIFLAFSLGLFSLPVKKAKAAEIHLNNSINKPYYLNQPGTTYILDEDITAEGSAFAVDADNVTFDLNGHKIIFGNTNVGLPNFDFDQGNGTAPSNWDLSLAPHATRVSTSEWPMVGNWSMKFTAPVAGEDIVSDWITITNPNRTYQAYVLMSSKKAILVKVEYQDGRTVNPDYTNPQTDTSTIAFKPSSLGWGAGQYRLHLMLNPAVTPGGTFYLDYGDIRPALDAGINGLPYGWQAPDLPTPPGVHNNTVIKNGSIVEAVPGFKYRAITHSGNGLEITNTYARTSGGDSAILYSYTYSSINQNIHHNIFENPKVYVVNRMDLSNYGILAGTNMSFYNNKFSFGGGGIAIGLNGSTIYNNVFENSSKMTNHYSVTTYANSGSTSANAKIYGNRFLGGSAVFLSSNSVANEVFNNYFNLENEPCNTEYQDRLYTTAIRVYDYGSTTDPTRDNKIHDNLIEARAHFFTEFPGCRPGVSGIKTATGGQNEFYRNEIHVYREDLKSEAIALSALGPNLNGIHDNYLESNYFNIIYGDKFAAEADNGVYTNNTVVKRSTPISDEYYPIRAWYCCASGAVSNHLYLGNKTVDTSLLNFWYSLGTQYGTVEHDIRFFLNLRIVDLNNSGIDGATITINDLTGQQVYSGVTDAQGQIKNIDLRQIIQTFDIAKRTKVEVNYSPHQIIISKNGVTETKTLTMDANKDMAIILDGQANDPAVISNPVAKIDRTNKTVTISWTTDQPTTARLEYGRTESYGSVLSDNSVTTNHSLTIQNITSGDYHFKVSGLNAQNRASSSFDQTFFYLSALDEIQVVLSSDKSQAYPNDIITYSLNYINNSGGEATNAKIEDFIPGRATYIDGSASNGGTFDGSKVIWNLGNLAAGQSGTVTFKVNAP